FATLAREKVEALFVSGDGFFGSRRVQLAMLAVRYLVPAIYSLRDYAEAGGLMSYGTPFPEVYRQTGVYTGNILNGAKPADLPVLQPTKFDLVINTSAASLLGLEIPPTFLAPPAEVIQYLYLLPRLPTTGYGTFATSTDVRYAAAFGGKADISHGRRLQPIN